MGAYFNRSGKIFLGLMGVQLLSALYDAYRQSADAAANPTRNMDDESKVLYYTLLQFRRNDDWSGYNKFCDQCTPPVPMDERLRMWERLA